jgi:chromodomain-helicase-DNA-binding protein 7
LSNSRTAKYSVLNGSYTFNKSSFEAEETDATLRVDDPDFWKIVLKNSKSESERLTKIYEDSLINIEYFLDHINGKFFMDTLSTQVTDLIDLKIKGEGGYSENDENTLLNLLQRLQVDS